MQYCYVTPTKRKEKKGGVRNHHVTCGHHIDRAKAVRHEEGKAALPLGKPHKMEQKWDGGGGNQGGKPPSGNTLTVGRRECDVKNCSCLPATVLVTDVSDYGQ